MDFPNPGEARRGPGTFHHIPRVPPPIRLFAHSPNLSASATPPASHPIPEEAMEDSGVWIYHERQEALLCGQHALNNLVQAKAFSPEALAEIAHRLDQVELAYMADNNEGGTRSRDYLARLAEGSGNVDPGGNFSIEVLRAALADAYGIGLPSLGQEGVLRGRDVTEVGAFVCHRRAHWFAIRRINGRYWNLDSMNERPVAISHFGLAAEIDQLRASGYSVFCADPAPGGGGLPPECRSRAQRSRGLPEFWWKEEDLARGVADAITGATDPWRNVGTGMRLDGGGAGGGRGAAADVAAVDVSGLTEEEMMQLAMMQSLEAATAAPAAVDLPSSSPPSGPVPPEPAPGDPGAVRVQFRLPDGRRVVRRFLGADPVGGVYGYVAEEAGGRAVELRAGFPPTELEAKRGMTVGEAKLAGEMVQCRYR